MAGDVKLTFRVEDNGSLAVLDQAGNKLDEVNRKAGTAGREGASAFEGMWGAATKAAAAVGAVALGWKVYGEVMQQFNLADRYKELSAQTGQAVETLSRYSIALKTNGSDIESFAQGMRLMSRSMIEGDKAFGQLGVSLRDNTGRLRDANSVLLDVADRFRIMPDGPTKTAAAMDIFGRSAGNLIPFLNEGRAGLESWAQQAERLGLVISAQTAEAADKFNDNLTILRATVGGLALSMGEALLPSLISVTDGMIRWSEANRDLVATGISDYVERWVDGASQILGALEPVLDAVAILRDGWSAMTGGGVQLTESQQERVRYRASHGDTTLAQMSAANRDAIRNRYDHNYSGFVGPMMPSASPSGRPDMPAPQDAAKVADELTRAQDSALGLSVGLGEIEKRLRQSQTAAVEFVDALAQPLASTQPATFLDSILGFFTDEIPSALTVASDAISTAFNAVFSDIANQASSTAQIVSGTMRNITAPGAGFSARDSGFGFVGYGSGYGISFDDSFGGFSTPDGGVGYSNGLDSFFSGVGSYFNTISSSGGSISGINGGSSFGSGFGSFGASGGSAPGPSKHDIAVSERAASSIWEGIKVNTAPASPFTAADLFPSTGLSAKKLGNLAGGPVDWAQIAAGNYAGLQLGAGGRAPAVSGKGVGGINLTSQALDAYNSFEGLGILLGITASDFNGGESGDKDTVSNVPGGLGIAAVKRASLLGLTASQIEYEKQKIVATSGYSTDNALNILNEQLYASADVYNNPYKNKDDLDQVVITQNDYNKALKTTIELFSGELPNGVDAYAIALEHMATGPMGSVVDILEYNKALERTVEIASSLQSSLGSGASSAFGGSINAIAAGGRFNPATLASAFGGSVGQAGLATVTGMLTNQLTNSASFKQFNAALFQGINGNSAGGVETALAMLPNLLGQMGGSIQSVIPIIKQFGKFIEEATQTPDQFYSSASGIGQAKANYLFGQMSPGRQRRTALGSAGDFKAYYERAMADGTITSEELRMAEQKFGITLGQLGALNQSGAVKRATLSSYDLMQSLYTTAGDNVAFRQVNAGKIDVQQLILSQQATETLLNSVTQRSGRMASHDAANGYANHGGAHQSGRDRFDRQRAAVRGR